jgi:hypothetical protein
LDITTDPIEPHGGKHLFASAWFVYGSGLVLCEAVLWIPVDQKLHLPPTKRVNTLLISANGYARREMLLRRRFCFGFFALT